MTGSAHCWRNSATADLNALSLLLPVYVGDLGTPDDRERMVAAMQMLHAERQLPEDDQKALQRALEPLAA